MKYIVIEIQKQADGAISIVPPAAYEDRNRADAAYHAALAAAAVSDVACHSVAMITDEGRFVKNELYTH